MSKSERLRLLEMEVLRLEFAVEQMSLLLEALLESQDLSAPTLDSGKWYNRKMDKEND